MYLKIPSQSAVLIGSKVILQYIKLHKWANVNLFPFMEIKTQFGNLTYAHQYQDYPKRIFFIPRSS